MSFYLRLFVALCIFLQVFSEKLEYHTFEPPFADVDHSGERLISRHWRSFGTTAVNSNFIRLTPDRQSKKGAIWSRKALGVPSFSSIVKFRISGQGKNFFGDGLAVWLVQQGYYTEGTLHGFHEKFIGIGIIFDTFKNTESLSAHRDVTVLVNDGEKTWELMTEEVKGCNINVRYHNDRADFSVSDASRAKIMVDENNLSVMVDARNTGEWTSCVNITKLGLPTDWVRKTHIGMSASTGQLADNHDVLSLLTYSDFSAMESEEAANVDKKLFDTAPNMNTAERFLRLEEAMNKISTQQEFFDHHLEHELAAVEDHMESLKSKLEKREDKSESRIVDLEGLVKKEVDGSITFRLNKMDLAIKNDINSKIARIEGVLSRLQLSVDDTGKTIITASNDWKLPFYILLTVLIVASIAMYFFYQHLLKKWKLP